MGGRCVGWGAATPGPLDTKRSARSAEPQYRLVREDARQARGGAVLQKRSARSTGPAV